MNSIFIVAAIGEWNRALYEKMHPKLEGEWYFVDDPKDLLILLKKVTPKYIFFPHWRWVVPEEVVKTHQCICFHMTDLPYGRGGSPLQNLILRGHKTTMLTALRMEKDVDAGPVYLKEPMSLEGAAWEVYLRASELAWKLILKMVTNNLIPVPQVGEPTFFKRRKPAESELPDNLSPEGFYDFVRMLDAPDYPKAFICRGNYRLEFDQASFINGQITARVTLTEHEIVKK